MMNMLRTFSIRFRLFSLTLLLCAFTAGTSFIGYHFLVKTGADMNTMYGDALLPVFWINDTRNNTQAVRANLYALMLTENEAENAALLADIGRRSKLNDENLANYRAADIDPYEVEHLALAEKYLAEGRQALSRSIELAMQNKNAEAYTNWQANGMAALGVCRTGLRNSVS